MAWEHEQNTTPNLGATLQRRRRIQNGRRSFKARVSECTTFGSFISSAPSGQRRTAQSSFNHAYRVEHIPDACRSETHVHFDELRGRRRNERHPTLSSHSPMCTFVCACVHMCVCARLCARQATSAEALRTSRHADTCKLLQTHRQALLHNTSLSMGASTHTHTTVHTLLHTSLAAQCSAHLAMSVFPSPGDPINEVANKTTHKSWCTVQCTPGHEHLPVSRRSH
eukprot:1157587-Pelagomonas_calceolata.AAC.5